MAFSIFKETFVKRNLTGCLYESWEGTASGTGQQTRSEHYCHKFAVTFYETGTFSILSRPGAIPLVQGRIPAQLEQYHLYKLRDEKRPALLNFSFFFERRAFLFNILTKQSTRAAGKKIHLKFMNILKYTNSQQRTNKVTKNDLFQCNFRTLLKWQQCIQNISNNLREAD